MKKVLAVLTTLCCLTGVLAAKKHENNVPKPAKYESFENGVPQSWVLQGKGNLSINPWHYKLGKKSLQWDFKPGDVIRVNNSIGDPARRGGKNNMCFADMCVWIYNKKPMPGKNLRFEFREGEKISAYFDFPLNYSGWQCGFLQYKNSAISMPVVRKTFVGKVSEKTDNILIKAPKDTAGSVLFDCIIYNGLAYYWTNFLPNKAPWQPTRLDENKFPRPKSVPAADLKAIERIKAQILPKVKITEAGPGNRLCEKVFKLIENLHIVEDSHGIRGKPITFPRGHGFGFRETRWMFEENNIDTSNILGLAEIRSGGRVLLSDRKKAIIQNATHALRQGISRKNFNKLAKQHAILWKYILDQGFNTSYYSGINDYSSSPGIYMRLLYLLRQEMFKQGLMTDVINYLQMTQYDLFAPPSSNNNMDHFFGIITCYLQAFLYSDAPAGQLQALRFISDKVSKEILMETGTGMKPDGSMFHGPYANTVIYGQRALYTLARIIAATNGSSFALSEAAKQRIKTCVMNLDFYSCKTEMALPMQETHPFMDIGKAYMLAPILKILAFTGKNGTLDDDYAQAYVNATGNLAFAKKHNLKIKHPSGHLSMPYAPLAAHRRKGWAAVAWGGVIDQRSRGNLYAYHTGNGPLEIMSEEGFFASGNQEAGWDWNRTNGATVLYIPELIDIKYLHAGRKIPRGKAKLARKMHLRRRIGVERGGISWRGINGCFRKTFYGDAFYNDFQGHKSYFFIGNRIYALGSNIKSDNKKYHVQTNLYQKVLQKKNSPTFVDGAKVTAFPVADKMLAPQKAHWLLDPVGNGYYVPANQQLFVARKTQKSRNLHEQGGVRKFTDSTGNFASAWLDHGIACKEAKYTYVILPYCGEAELAEFVKKAAAGKAFRVLQNDANAHIINDKIANFYAGIFFRGGKVRNLPHVANVGRECQIMYRENKGALEIAVGDPEIHHQTKLRAYAQKNPSVLMPLKVKFAGAWKLAKPVDGVKIISSNKQKTVIEFGCIHGKSFNFALTK